MINGMWIHYQQTHRTWNSHNRRSVLQISLNKELMKKIRSFYFSTFYFPDQTFKIIIEGTAI